MEAKLNHSNNFYTAIEHAVLYAYGSWMYYTLPLARTILNHPFNIDKVTDNLYISDFSSACDIKKLHENGITHIVSIIPGVTAMYPNEFKYHTIDVVDRPYSNIEAHFADSVEFMDNAIKNGGKVLVHCQMGVSRSATIVLAYLIKKQGYTTNDAISKLKECRQCINPNPGFVKQLVEYESR
jgi:protein tyrosine phosphatase (PTP) superfamily phosphohydrolase (DUF442 family)